MPDYRSGDDVLADARLRLSALGQNRGIVVLEGSDDRRLLGPHLASLNQIVVAGGKPKLLNAYRRRSDSDTGRIVFITDCDYDVSAGHLVAGVPDLILTSHADLEADLVTQGLVRRVVAELVPNSLESDDSLSRITDHVVGEAFALARRVGRLRELNQTESLGLNFQDLNLSRFRTKGESPIDEPRLIEVLVQRSAGASITVPELNERAGEIPIEQASCRGHDLVDAIGCVLRQEYRIPLGRLASIPSILRSGFDREAFEQSGIGIRLSSWEATHGRSILRA